MRARGLWPRSLAPPPLTPSDRRAYAMYSLASQRRLDQEIKVSTGAGDGAQPTGAPEGPRKEEVQRGS